MGTTFQGNQSAKGFSFAIVVSKFNDHVTSKLLQGAREAFRDSGADPDQIDTAFVPGSVELSVVALKLAKTHRYDAIVCLGAVIRGDTDHYEHVATQAASGLSRVALDTGVPCIFGVLTTVTQEHAMDRAGGKHDNKGYEAAVTAIEMASLLRSLGTD